MLPNGQMKSAADETTARSGFKCRVLVVEDERIVAHNLQQRLIKLGYDVPAIVASGEQALQKINSLQPDVVLMDINIEGPMDGIETVKHIPADLHVPVIYLTAYSEDATLERARETSPYGYLVKPFSERALHATIQMVLERRRTDLALLESEERLRLAMDAAEMGSWELDLVSRRLLRLGAAVRIFGFERELIVGTWDTFMDRVHPEDRDRITKELEHSITMVSPFNIEFRSLDDGGEIRWLKVQGNIFPSRRGPAASRVIGVVQDISERKQSELHLQQAATVFEASPDGIIVLDNDRCIIAANRSYCEVVGQEPDEVVGTRPYFLSEDVTPVDQLMEIEYALRAQGRWSGEFVGHWREGEQFHMLANLAMVRDGDGGQNRCVAVFSDLTAVRNAERKLFYLAHHDVLTGLPNRLLARERLERSLERARRHRTRVALLFIDLDYFKRVNDTLGHNVGDELLRVIARRMQSCVRSEDTVARQGGDEFMVILDDIANLEDVTVVATKIIAALNQQILLESCELCISPSIGISLFPDNCLGMDDLISAADSAMYVAKEQGRNRYEFYTEEMTSEAARYIVLDQELRRGLQQDEFLLYFQPQLSLQTGEMVGVEALIRWRHPSRGLLGADEFIPFAEDNGLIVDIGEWVLRRACQQVNEWNELGLSRLRMAVNVSARQMRDDRLIKSIKEALLEFSIPAGQLEIEITESTLQSGSDCIDTLQQLKELGVPLSVDDFGIGYSCLSSLKYLPINRVKIDRAFVRDMQIDPNDVAITDAIIAMAHRLHLQVIAEGVETMEQEELLRQRGCDEAQGYLYAKPLPADALLTFYRRHKPRR